MFEVVVAHLTGAMSLFLPFSGVEVVLNWSICETQLQIFFSQSLGN